MTASPHDEDDVSQRPLQEWVDERADQFETAWDPTASPRAITELLGDATGRRRRLLLYELVRIDLECRWRAGQPRHLDDYVPELPELLGPDGSLPDELVLAVRSIAERYGGDVSLAGSWARLRPPAADAAARIRCPHCGQPVQVVEVHAAQVTCGSCGSTFHVEASRAPTAEAAQLPRILGKFQLWEVLGSGAFGTVYKARDAELGRTVALKLPRTGCFSSHEESQRFLHEAQSAARLRHPGIVPVYEIGHEGDLAYIVTDFIEGQTLGQYAAQGSLSPKQIAELVAEIADALQHAHAEGVIHRDVKPNNVLIDGQGHPHVADFGLARDEAGEAVITLDGQILGTPAYMSPEQAAGRSREVDARSDVYSLGVVLYELLTGERPFRGNARMLLHQVLEDDPRPPRRLNDRIPRDLETICLKCMAKSPARRYASAGDLAGDLRRVVRGEPIQARPIHRVERAWRWCRRNPVVAGLTAAVLLVLLLGVVVAGFFAVSANQNATAARSERDRANEHARRIRVEQARTEAEKKKAVQARSDAERARDEALQHRDRAAYNLGRHYWGVAVARRDTDHAPLAASHYFTMAAAEFASSPADSRNAQWLADSLVGDLSLEQVLHHAAEVRGAVYGAGGSRILTWGGEGDAEAVRLWDAESGKLLVSLGDLPGKTNGAIVNSDASRVFTWGFYSVGQLWDTPSGQLLWKCEEQKYIDAARFDKDERRILGWGRTGKAWLWDVETGKTLAEFPHNDVSDYQFDELSHEDRKVQRSAYVNGAAFDPPGSRVLSWADDGSARLWDAATGARLAEFRHDEIMVPKRTPEVSRSETPGDSPAAQETRPANVTGAEFSQDGSPVLTWSDDDTVRVWDANNGSQLVQFKHGEEVAGATFDQQQRRVLTWCADDSVRLWDVQTGNQLVEFQGAGRGAAFNRDGSRVLSWGGGQPVRLSNAETGEVLVEFPHAAGNAAFHRDADRVLTWGLGTARLWDAATGQAIGLFQYQENMNYGPAFHPDGDRILSWNGDSALVWGVPAKKKLVEFAHQGPAKGAVLNQDDSRLLTWNDSDEARWWDLRTGQLLTMFPGHAVMNPGGSRLLIRSGDAVKVLDAATGETVVELKHNDEVQGAELSPDASRVLSWGGAAGRIWDAQTGRLLLEHSGLNSDARFSPDASRVLGWTSQLKSSTEYESRLFAWDAKAGRRLCECELAGEIRGAAFSPDGKSLLAWGQPPIETTQPQDEGALWLWDAATGQLRAKFDSGAVDGAAFNSDGSRVWSWGHFLDERHTMRVFSWATLWDAATGNRLLKVDHDAGMEGPLFNRDRSRIVSWRWALEENWGDQLRLLDARTGQALVEFAGGGRVLGAILNSDETRLLTWSDDAARLWDTRTGRVLFEHKCPGSSFGAQFARDGSRLLCWSGNAAWLWDGTTGDEPVPCEHGGRVLGAQLSRDESHILSWGEDGRVRWWDVTIDDAWPRESLVLRLEARTKTGLDQVGQVKPLPYHEWLDRKRQYDQTQSDRLPRHK